MSKKIELKGKKFGRWTVLEEHGRASNGGITWLCKCECGSEVVVNGATMRRGESLSCGCLREHGFGDTRLHNIWSNMKQRCTNPKTKRYKHYGGKGVTVHEEWFDDFMAFYEWSKANGYKEHLTIDRIDVDGNYEPSNCRWITNRDQQFNKTVNHNITFNGKTQTVTEWARELGIEENTLFTRLKYGWTEERALTQPVQKCVKRVKNI